MSGGYSEGWCSKDKQQEVRTDRIKNIVLSGVVKIQVFLDMMPCRMVNDY
jgi:hypothetical protein